MKLRLLCLGIILSAGLPLRAAEMPRWEGGLDTGASIPVGSNSQAYGISPLIGGSVFYQLQEFLALGLEARYDTGHSIGVTGHGDPFGFGLPAYDYSLSVNSDLHVFTFGPQLKIGPWMDAGGFRVKPYGLVGLGWTHYWEAAGTLTSTAFLPPPIGTVSGQSAVSAGSSDAAGFDVGSGIELQVTERFVIGVEVRYQRFFAGKYTFAPNNGDGQYIAPTARLGILF